MTNATTDERRTQRTDDIETLIQTITNLDIEREVWEKTGDILEDLQDVTDSETATADMTNCQKALARIAARLLAEATPDERAYLHYWHGDGDDDESSYVAYATNPASFDGPRS